MNLLCAGWATPDSEIRAIVPLLPAMASAAFDDTTRRGV